MTEKRFTQKKAAKKQASRRGRRSKNNTQNKITGPPVNAVNPVNQSNNIERLDFGQKLIRSGFSVQLAKGKKPFRKAWQKLPLSEKELTKAFEDDPSLNIVIMTGYPMSNGVVHPKGSVLTVLDSDDEDVTEMIFKNIPELKDYFYVQRCNERAHFYFLHEADSEIPKNTSISGAIDFQSKGKCVVGPYSKHPSGDIYKSHNDISQIASWSDYKDTIYELFPELHKKTKSSNVQKKYSGDLNRIEALTNGSVNLEEGERNNLCFELCCRMSEAGMSEETALAYLKKFCLLCKPPFPENEAMMVFERNFSEKLQQSANDGFYNVKPLPRHKEVFSIKAKVFPNEPPVSFDEIEKIPLESKLISDLPEFPKQALPAAVRLMVSEVVKANPATPKSFALTVALGLLSCAMGKSYSVRIKDSHEEYGNFYILLAMPSNMGKSYTLGILRKPFDIKQDALAEENNRNKFYIEAEKAHISAKISDIKSGLAGLDGDSLANAKKELSALMQEMDLLSPTYIRLYVNNTTSEALIDQLADNDGQASIIDSEGKIVLEIAGGRYSAGGDVDIFLKGASGDPIIRLRRKDGAVEIPEPIISSVVATQLEPLLNMLNNKIFDGLGFKARILLYIFPSREKSEEGKQYNDISIDPEIEKDYQELLNKILQANIDCIRKEQETVKVKMSAGAKELFKQYHRKLSEYEEQAKDDVELSTVYDKCKAFTARVALVLQVAHDLSYGRHPQAVSKKATENAIKIIEFFVKHAEASYQLSQEFSGTAKAKLIYDWCLTNHDKILELRQKDKLGEKFLVKPADLVS